MKDFHQTITGSLLLMSLACLLTNAAAADTNQADTIPVPSLNASCSNIESTLRAFVKLAATDAELSGLLATNHLLIEYRLSDSERTLYFGLDGGKMVSAFGQPPHPAELTVVSDAQTLDRFLRGESVDAKLTLHLHLSLSRKIELARNRAALMAHISRIYTLAGSHVFSEKPTLVAQSVSR